MAVPIRVLQVCLFYCCPNVDMCKNRLNCVETHGMEAFWRMVLVSLQTALYSGKQRRLTYDVLSNWQTGTYNVVKEFEESAINADVKWCCSVYSQNSSCEMLAHQGTQTLNMPEWVQPPPPGECKLWCSDELSVFGTRTYTHTHKAKPIHPRYAGCIKII